MPAAAAIGTTTKEGQQQQRAPFRPRTARERHAQAVYKAHGVEPPAPRRQLPPHKRPLPVSGFPAVHRFNPTRATACDAVGVPYGAVGVEGQPAHVRSYEMRLDRRDGSCFLPREPRPVADRADHNRTDHSRS